MREPLIQRYEHHGFTGWVVSTTRRSKRFTRYFSDHRNGQRKALQAARVYRDKLLSRLPPPRKTKITNKRNTTGVMGVCRHEVRRRSGRWFVRYIAEWPKSDGTKGTASFSVNLPLVHLDHSAHARGLLIRGDSLRRSFCQLHLVAYANGHSPMPE